MYVYLRILTIVILERIFTVLACCTHYQIELFYIILLFNNEI
jgi:hypothetical protein